MGINLSSLDSILRHSRFLSVPPPPSQSCDKCRYATAVFRTVDRDRSAARNRSSRLPASLPRAVITGFLSHALKRGGLQIA